MTGFLVPLSAAMLALSYFLPCYCLLLISVFLIPIFMRVYSGHTFPLSDWTLNGFIWGVCFFSLHWIFILSALKTYTTFIWCLIIYLFLVFYAAVCSALWFYCSALGTRMIHTALSWVISTWIYFILLEQYALIPLGFPGGYSCANPVCLLAYAKGNTIPFSSVGSSFLLLVCICLQMIMVILIKKRMIYGSVLLYGFCIVGWLILEKHECFITYPITCISPLGTHSTSYLDCAQQLTTSLISEIFQKHDTQIISMPEGSFPYPLNQHPEIISMWTDNALHEKVHLLIGAYYQEGDQLYNCMYHIYQCRIMQIYRKKNLMPFTENLFTSGTSTINNKNRFTLTPISEFTVAICSDFFLAPGQYKDADTLLLLVNDTWFMPYMQYILYLYADAFTREHNIELVYSSYSCYTSKRDERT
jgi:apolipoprotein N-acyltransferase